MRDLRFSWHILPHKSRGRCTEVPASVTCSAFCNHSCSHTRSARGMTLMLMAMYSSGAHIILLSSPTPRQLVMTTQVLVAVSSPRCDHPLLTFSSRAARVGGICGTGCFLGKSFLLAWSTLVQVLVLSNRSMTYSIMFIASSGISFGPSA